MLEFAASLSHRVSSRTAWAEWDSVSTSKMNKKCKQVIYKCPLARGRPSVLFMFLASIRLFNFFSLCVSLHACVYQRSTASGVILGMLRVRQTLWLAGRHQLGQTGWPPSPKAPCLPLIRRTSSHHHPRHFCMGLEVGLGSSFYWKYSDFFSLLFGRNNIAGPSWLQLRSSCFSFPSAGLQTYGTKLRPDSIDWFQNPFQDQVHVQMLHVLAQCASIIFRFIISNTM